MEEAHNYDGLAGRLIAAYEGIAERPGRRDILAALAGLRHDQTQDRFAGSRDRLRTVT